MNAEMINERDLITMKLLYYFITIKIITLLLCKGLKMKYGLKI